MRLWGRCTTGHTMPACAPGRSESCNTRLGHRWWVWSAQSWLLQVSIIGLRQGRESWESLSLPARKQSLILLDQVCLHASSVPGRPSELSCQWGEWSAWRSWECPTCWAKGRTGKVLSTCPFSCRKSSIQPLPLWNSSHCWQICQTAASVLHLSETGRVCLPSRNG